MRPLSDDEAWIISHETRLVRAWISRYYSRHHDKDALLSAGYLGLCSAIKSFDPERGIWSFHAVRHIRSAIDREIKNSLLIHVPVYHRTDSEHPRHMIGKKNHGVAAERMVQVKYVSLDSEEAAPALAVSHERESENPDPYSLKKYLCELREKQAIVLCRVVMQGELISDVARDMGINHQYVGKIRDKALMHLRMRLAQERPELATAHH